MRKVLIVSGILTAIAALIYFDFIEIVISKPRTELKKEVKTVNNSAIETLQYFSEDENDNLFHSKILVLNFWYPTCGACAKEKANLDMIQKKFQNEDIRFLSYCPPTLFSLSTNLNKAQKLKHNFQAIDFKPGVKMSILKVASNNRIEVDTTLNSFPNTVIISTRKDSILYFTQANIKDADLSKIYELIQKELDEIN